MNLIIWTMAETWDEDGWKSSLYYGWPNILKENRKKSRTLNCKLNGGPYYQWAKPEKKVLKNRN